MKRLLEASLLAAVVCLAGCQNGGRLSLFPALPHPVEKIDRVEIVMNPPAPLNWDDDPGLDGLLVQVYFWRLDEDQKLAVPASGTLQLLLYEGLQTADEAASKPAFQSWTFTDAQLAGFLSRSIFGWGYGMPLAWGKHVPTSRSVTLIARHRSVSGVVTSSKPLNVAMGPT